MRPASRASGSSSHRGHPSSSSFGAPICGRPGASIAQYDPWIKPQRRSAEPERSVLVYARDEPRRLGERLSAAGAQPSRSALAGTLGAALLAACERFTAQGLAAFAEDFAARDALRDRSVTVQEATAWQGIARGVDAAGALQVQTADGGLRAVHAGDVSVRAAS